MAKAASKSNDSSANIGFEAKLWLAADKLRNNMVVEYRKILNAGADGFCDVFELDHRSSLPQIFTAETLRRRKNQGKSPIGAYLA